MPSHAVRRISEVRAETLLGELLSAQGWDIRRPPNGDLLRQQEYKDYPTLLEIFRGRSKTGKQGDALPEAVLIDRDSLTPLAVIEAKARQTDLDQATKEAKDYARACIDAGFSPLAIALAGTSEEGFSVSVSKWKGSRWVFVTYENTPINWIPNRVDVDKLRPANARSELRPTVPPVEVLANYADEINRLLRESGIQDAFRPAVVGAIMLALWKSRGDIRLSPSNILQDINQACEQAFWKTHKPELAASLRVDVANDVLAVKARRIVGILERLNITVLTAEHDYLGQLYETFFQYTGGNTIGQYFTPRHIAAFMADLIATDTEDVVLDPACGTGGFLIAAMHRVLEQRRLSRAQVVKLIQNRLIGFDKEPVTAALCVANMILRGDGSAGIHRGDLFTSSEYPIGKATAVLMNPPFPHRKTDTPPENFLHRALEALKHRGRAAVIMPTSHLVKKDKRGWREKLLAENTLEGIVGLPDDLFEPFASSYTGVVLVTKGVPHPKGKQVFFARITHDGFEIRKRVRVRCDGEQLSAVSHAHENHETVAGLCGWSPVDEESLVFGPGLYVPARPLSTDEILREVRSLIRNRSAFVVRYAPSLWRLAQAVTHGELIPRSYKEIKNLPGSEVGEATIGGFFEIAYGQRALHSKRTLKPGPSLVISSSGVDNGCYGFFDFDDLIAPPFVTVPSTGSIGQAHVQEWPCGVTDDCLILIPKKGTPKEVLYVASAVIRWERWRYSYGMKITPERIADYPLPIDNVILDEVRSRLATARKIEAIAIKDAEEDEDLRIAQLRLDEIDENPDKLVTGKALELRLARAMK